MVHQTTFEDGGRILLIRAALALLNDVHPEDLSIREVARRVNLSSSAPYHHFKTKIDLLAACAAVAWGDLIDQLEADDTTDARQQLLNRATAYLAYGRANPGPYRLINSRLFPPEEFAGIHELRVRVISGVMSIIIAARDTGVDRDEAKFLSLSLWSMLHGHLILNNEPDDLFVSRDEFDRAIAHLATEMVLGSTDA